MYPCGKVVVGDCHAHAHILVGMLNSNHVHAVAFLDDRHEKQCIPFHAGGELILDTGPLSVTGTPPVVCLRCSKDIEHVPYKYLNQTFHAVCVVCDFCGEYRYTDVWKWSCECHFCWILQCRVEWKCMVV